MRKIRSIVVLVLALTLISCAALQSIGITVKPYSEMTPKEKMTLLFKTYNKQWDDYQLQSDKPILTEPERQVLRSRKKVLTEVYPLLFALDSAIVEGKPFEASTEKLIIDKLRSLGAKIK